MAALLWPSYHWPQRPGQYIDRSATIGNVAVMTAATSVFSRPGTSLTITVVRLVGASW